MGKYEWGKCRLNVVTFRLYIQTGMCVYPTVLKFLLSLLTHFMLLSLLSSLPLVPCPHHFNSSASLSFNSHSALPVSLSPPHQCPFPPLLSTLLPHNPSYPSLPIPVPVFSTGLFSPFSVLSLHPFHFLPQLFPSHHHKPKYAGDVLPLGQAGAKDLWCSLTTWCRDGQNLCVRWTADLRASWKM